MNTKTKHMIENMHQLAQNDEPATGLIDQAKKLLKRLNCNKSNKTRLVAVGAAGIVAAAGITYLLTRKNK